MDEALLRLWEATQKGQELHVCAVPRHSELGYCGASLAAKTACQASDNQQTLVALGSAPANVSIIAAHWNSNAFASQLDPFGFRDVPDRVDTCCKLLQWHHGLRFSARNPPVCSAQGWQGISTALNQLPSQTISQKRWNREDVGRRQPWQPRRLHHSSFDRLPRRRAMQHRKTRAHAEEILELSREHFGVNDGEFRPRSSLQRILRWCASHGRRGVHVYSDSERLRVGRKLCATRKLGNMHGESLGSKLARQALLVLGKQHPEHPLCRQRQCRPHKPAASSSVQQEEEHRRAHAQVWHRDDFDRVGDEHECSSWHSEPPLSSALSQLQRALRAAGLETNNPSSACLFLPPFETTPLSTVLQPIQLSNTRVASAAGLHGDFTALRLSQYRSSDAVVAWLRSLRYWGHAAERHIVADQTDSFVPWLHRAFMDAGTARDPVWRLHRIARLVCKHEIPSSDEGEAAPGAVDVDRRHSADSTAQLCLWAGLGHEDATERSRPDARGSVDPPAWLSTRLPLIGKSNSIRRYERTKHSMGRMLLGQSTFSTALHHTTTCANPAARHINSMQASMRPLLASFRGSIWDRALGRDPAQTRRRLMKLHDPLGAQGRTIIAESSLQCGIDEDDGSPRGAAGGGSPRPSYDKRRYVELLSSSVFCFAPRGAGLHSYRMVEAVGCGCVPVLLEMDLALPFEVELTDACGSASARALSCPPELQWWVQPIHFDVLVSVRGDSFCRVLSWDETETGSALVAEPLPPLADEASGSLRNATVRVVLGAYYVRVESRFMACTAPVLAELNGQPKANRPATKRSRSAAPVWWLQGARERLAQAWEALLRDGGTPALLAFIGEIAIP